MDKFQKHDSFNNRFRASP